jgi:hypothetical protein
MVTFYNYFVKIVKVRGYFHFLFMYLKYYFRKGACYMGLSDEFKDELREEYKQRTGFTDSDYYKVVSLSMKFYQQGAETGKDVLGNPLTEEEVQICKGLIVKMTKEIALAEENFYKEDVKEENE